MASEIEISNEGAPEILPINVLWKVYLLAYRNANLALFDREQFSRIIIWSFTVPATKVAFLQWA